MKIYIIGGPGSGKTFLAEKLSKQYGIHHYELDDLQWDNKSNNYGSKRDSKERDELLSQLLHKNDWIIEGVYYAWCGQCFEDADMIYLLNVTRFKYRYRIIRRYLRRKIGIEKGKKETLRSLSKLLKWADKYQRENLVEIKSILRQYQDKTRSYGDI
ncbi:MAG: AAA family ATPase [Eubacteriales bacterium]|nr:AAA family ATPase [Eubacteriales bacterium]